MPVRNYTISRRDEIFTPYARIPPIKKTLLQNNLISTSSSSTDYKQHTQKPKVPFTPSKLPLLRPKGYSNKIPSSSRILIRRNTYVVLEPVVLKKPRKSDQEMQTQPDDT